MTWAGGTQQSRQPTLRSTVVAPATLLPVQRQWMVAWARCERPKLCCGHELWAASKTGWVSKRTHTACLAASQTASRATAKHSNLAPQELPAGMILNCAHAPIKPSNQGRLQLQTRAWGHTMARLAVRGAHTCA